MGLFFPALSAIIFYAPSMQDFQFITGQPGAYHLEALQELRSNPEVMLNISNLPGLVTFPSFHTAMGIICIYCARHHPVLFGLSLAVNVTMIASTPLFGAHYGVDVLAGAFVALTCVMGLRWSEQVIPLTNLLKQLYPGDCKDSDQADTLPVR